MFYDQLKKLCDKAGTTPTYVVEKLGMSRGTMSNWKKGGIPNGEALVRFSEFFNVTTDYLLLGKESSVVTPSLSEGDQLILEKVKNLTEVDKIQIAGALPFIIATIQRSQTIEPLFSREKAAAELFRESTGGKR